MFHRGLWFRSVSSWALLAVPVPGGGQPSTQGTRKGRGESCRTTAASLGLLLRRGPGLTAQPGQEAVTNADSQPLQACCTGPRADTFLPGPGPLGGWKQHSTVLQELPSFQSRQLRWEMTSVLSLSTSPVLRRPPFRAEPLKAAIWHPCRLVHTQAHVHAHTLTPAPR